MTKIERLALVNVADPWLKNGGDRPSLGTLYLASWIKEKGLADVKVIDMNHSDYKKFNQFVKDYKPDLIGISLTTPQYYEAKSLAWAIKMLHPDIPIIAGGSHPTAMQNVRKIPELMPVGLFDYVVTGSGESILEKICKEGLPTNQRILRGELPDIKSLDWLPEPDRRLIEIEKYDLKILGKKCQPMMTSFGCPYHCTFCSEPILNNKFKAYSPERVVKEMKNLKENFGTEAIMIYDDVYSIDAKRAIAIADLMIKENLNLIYRCTTRATDFIRYPELAKKLKESGCVEVCVGVESGDNNILKTSDKGMSVEANEKGIKAIKDSGMRCLTYMITGLPGCSKESEQKSFEFILKNEPDEIGWYMLAPFPSTPLWVSRDKYGLEIYEDEIIRNDWDVAQCRSDNEKLTCYISYEKSNGLNRVQIKELWLEMRDKTDKWNLDRGRKGIQDIDMLASVK